MNSQTRDWVERERRAPRGSWLSYVPFWISRLPWTYTICDHFGIQEKAAVHGCCSRLPSLRANNLDVLLDGVDPLGVRVLPISNAKSR